MTRHNLRARRGPSASLRATSLRAGFTLTEVILSMTLMLALLGMTTQLFRRQSTSVATQTGRLDAQQNSRFALSMLERELRVAGVGVVDAQPLLVMANKLGITFNADLVALDTADFGAVYINADADSASAGVFRNTAKLALPGTSTLYPDSTYMQGAGVTSNAETISYWLTPDSTSGYSNEYVLMRRVNAQASRLVARGILYNALTDTVFHYFKGDSLGNLTEISPASLPVIHKAAIHGSQADTGKSALADSIRVVKAQFTSVFHDPRTGAATTRRLDLTIKLMNAGLIHHSTCGNAPLAASNVTASVTAANGTTIPQPYVTISWSPSVDDGAGEKDVERYAIYRRLSSVTTFDQPIASIPAGRASYSFQDNDVQSGQSWIYGIASQDCTPASSGIAQSSTTVIP